MQILPSNEINYFIYYQISVASLYSHYVIQEHVMIFIHFLIVMCSLWFI